MKEKMQHANREKNERGKRNHTDICGEDQKAVVHIPQFHL